MRKRHFPIQYKIMLLIVTIIGLSLILTGLIVERAVVPRFERQIALHARDLAFTVAEIPEVKKYVDWPEAEHLLQALLEEIAVNSNVKFILAIGGRDAEPVLAGEPYSSLPEVTTLGPTVRAYVPVSREGKKVGAVAVYFWTNDINLLIWNLRKKIIMAIIIAMIVGVFFAHLLSKNIKRTMLGMEPHELAALLTEREILLESVKEGILAVDKNGLILFVNTNARSMMNLPPRESLIGEPLERYVPNSRLKEVIQSGEAETDQEQDLGRGRIITNRIPLKVRGKIYGAIASFRNIDEMQVLAEELTGAQKMAELLRVQNEILRVQKHEFLNKIHAISGLLQLEDYQAALRLIRNESIVQQETIEYVTTRVQQPAVAGLILGKIGRCRELEVDFRLDESSRLGPVGAMDPESLIICIGNLVENAIDAVLFPTVKRKAITLYVSDLHGNFEFWVRDTGVGMEEKEREKIFEKGFSTKKGGKRGYGLFLVKTIVESFGGSVRVLSRVNNGTCVMIKVPGGEKNGESTDTDAHRRG
ncbi:MAG: ATP-binding protein [Synergistales bacterium]